MYPPPFGGFPGSSLGARAGGTIISVVAAPPPDELMLRYATERLIGSRVRWNKRVSPRG
jgi:hypothetical protein